jgi:hypothetical protein
MSDRSGRGRDLSVPAHRFSTNAARPAALFFAMDWRTTGISFAQLATLALIVLAAAGCNRGAITGPLVCPPGATLMGAPPPKGEEVWCQKIVAGRPLKDGLFIAYGDDGKPTIQGAYRDGLQDGAWTLWYENGVRASLDHYRAGVHEGLHTSWYANGVKAIEGNYRGGKRDGVWTRWDPTGLTSKQETYSNDRKIN